MRPWSRDTIVAIATPPGAGALGIVRVSGRDAIDIVETVLADTDKPLVQPTHTVRHVRLIDPESAAILDDALCTVMRGPGSYTGEDVVELSCHGNPVVLALVVERLSRAGARHANPGEFTRRAFVNGRLDLARAEAVALLIEARSERAALAAARAMSGDLSRRLARLHDALLDLIAGLEVALDFPDDEVGLTIAEARARARHLADDATSVEHVARRGRRMYDGMTVAIVGRTNAGKSSLFNALVGRNRAIVSPKPGTTRDVVEATVEIGGVAVRFLDTAGLGVPQDEVEAEGMVRSRAAIDESDLVLSLIDGSVPSDGTVLDAGARPVITVRSKSDLPVHRLAVYPPRAVRATTATPEGVADVIAAIRREIQASMGLDGREDGLLAVSLRQHGNLQALSRALRAATVSLETHSAEVALIDLHDALATISTLLGTDVGDDVLDRVFSTFCVGK
jgi:tRNA modification GTPase